MSLVLFFQNNTIQGAYVESSVKYISCRYLDYDNQGRCVRLERQPGVRCNPSETIYPYEKAYGWGKKGPDWADSRGWFMPLCQLPEQERSD